MLRRYSKGASSQAFSIVMVFAQYLTTCTLCFWLGSMTERGSSNFPEPSFAYGMVTDSTKVMSIILLLLGGCFIGYGDSAATMAIEHLGLGLGGPIVFGLSLSLGTVFDFVLQRDNTTSEAVLLFIAVACVFTAIHIDANSYQHNLNKNATKMAQVTLSTKKPKKDDVALRKSKSMVHLEQGGPQTSLLNNKDLYQPVSTEAPPCVAVHEIERPRAIKLALVGGVIMACWSPCSTAATYVDTMFFYSLFFWFQTGELVGIIPSVLIQINAAGDPKTFRDVVRDITSMTFVEVICASTAGVFVAIGYFCYFATSSSIPRATAFAIGSCSPLVNKGVAYMFNEYEEFSWKGKFYLLFSAFLYALAIYLLYLSTKDLTL